MKKNSFKGSSFKHLLMLIAPHWGPFTIAMIALGLGSGVNLLFPEIIRRVINSSSMDEYAGHPTLLALGLISLFAFQGLCFYVRIYFFGRIGQRVVTNIRKELFEKIILRPVSDFDTLKSSDLVSRLMNDTSLLQDAVSIKVSVLIRYILQVLVGVIAMVWISWRLTTTVLIALLILTGLSIVLARRLRAYSRELQAEIGNSAALAEESFSSIKVIRGFAREEYIRHRFNTAMERSYRIGLDRTSLSAFFQSFVNFLLNGCLVLVLLYGIYLSSNAVLSVGDLTAFLLYGAIVAVSFAFTTSAISELATSLGGVERVFELMGHKAAFHPGEVEPQSTPIRALLDQNVGAVFSNVTFFYPSRPLAAALTNVSFEVPAGKRTALVGISGAGKSTITNLLLGFYHPDEGKIEVGGIPLRDFSAEKLSKLIAFVPQENRLLNLSILETLRLGDETISTDEIRNALSQMQLLEFVELLPEGLETIVGEGGNLFSGGQKQRLAIARAMVRKPKLLILDEATASLDSENETAVQIAMQKLGVQTTQLIIAHRLSTIKDADHVIVLAGGRILQTGSFQELATEPGYFKEVIKMQALSEEI